MQKNNKNRSQKRKTTQNKRNRTGFPIGKDNLDIYAGHPRLQIGNFPGFGIPDRLRMRIIYGESFALTASNVVEYQYRGNGIYDPRAATGGGQPRYFDQIMGLYQQFYVVKSQSSVQIVNRSNDTYGVALFASSQSTALTDYYEAEEMQNGVVMTLIAPAQGDVKRLILEQSTKKMLSLPASDTSTWGTSLADPTNLWFHRVYVQNMTQSAATAGFFTLKLVYDVEFFDRRDVGASSFKLEAPKSAYKGKV